MLQYGGSCLLCFFFFKQKTAYEILRSDWSSDVCSSDLGGRAAGGRIFLASGNNAGGHSFVANEHLIGQGATGNTFDGFLGVQVPANGSLDTRPGVAGIRPVVGGQVTLAGGAIARGFNISTSGP